VALRKGGGGGTMMALSVESIDKKKALCYEMCTQQQCRREDIACALRISATEIFIKRFIYL
jgi:hypothetical protein